MFKSVFSYEIDDTKNRYTYFMWCPSIGLSNYNKNVNHTHIRIKTKSGMLILSVSLQLNTWKFLKIYIHYIYIIMWNKCGYARLR